MEKNKIIVLHDGRKLSPAMEKAISNGPWRLSIMPTRRSDWQVQAQGADCAVVVVESTDASGTAKIIKGFKEMDDNLPVVIITRSKSPESAVEAMKAGSFDYLFYPVDGDKLKTVILNAIKLYDLTKRVFFLESQVGWSNGLENIVGQSPQMQEIFGMIKMVAKSNATVLITGDSGTGKELVAQAIHSLSTRSKKKFLDINCGAIPRELLENELFGHERGAYTGADKRYVGSCERADGGTLFLDEISEMDPLLQVKLLRFLQERTFMRVGGNDPITVDVRIVAATNREILKDVKSGAFREDLYYRLNVVPIHIPPLRERAEDIPLLSKFFLDKYSVKNEKIFVDFAPQAMDLMVNYQWQGNVRELENVIERVVVLNNDSRVKPSHLPPQIQQESKRSDGSILPEPSMAPLDGQRIIPLEQVEKYAIEVALKRCLGNVSEAARKLRIGQATLYRKIKLYGLR
ncbi:MAG: sigma-54-dependent Fis family transcriptional regulator [Deltaproteobacteria bacterium]|jgi:two-component system, NtrC family, response regulator HydG|nr:sigma-54-dependent Fis family transcriptional regulator [Deltaproteobacteria bacterium]